MPGFVTDAVVLGRVCDLLGVNVGNLPPKWQTIVQNSNTSAYQEILGRLITRGYTPAQINLWDRGAEFQTDLALFWSLTKGGALSNYSDVFLKALDRRKDLDTVILFIGQAWKATGDTPGTIGSGAVSGSGDVFGTPISPSDPRIGDPDGTRW